MLLQVTGVNDRDVLRGVKDDVEKRRYHIACNRVFEYAHKGDINKVKEDESWGAADLDTIVHPNTYFKRSYLLRNGVAAATAGGGAGVSAGKEDVEMQM